MKQTLANTGVVIWSSGTDTVARTDFNTAFTNLEGRVPVMLTGTRPSAGSARRFHVDPATGNLTYDTGTEWITVGSSVERMNATGTVPSQVVSTFKGAPTQTANLTEWKNSAGTTLASVSASGVATFPENVLGGTDGALRVIPSASSRRGLIVRAADGQTVSLQEWHSSTGAILASVSQAGAITTVSDVYATGKGTFGSVDTGTAKATRVEGTTTANAYLFVTRGSTGYTKDFAHYRDTDSEPRFRVTSSGQALASQLVIGGSYTGDTNFETSATAWVRSTLAGIPTLLLTNAGSQTAHSINVVNSGGSSIFSVSNGGSVSSVGSASFVGSGTFQGGIYTTPAPLAIGGTTPVAEIITGTATGAYEDNFVLRHTATSASVATRTSRVVFKLSDETGTNSAKMAGIGAQSTAASSASPRLTGWQNNEIVFQFDTNKHLTLQGDIIPVNKLSFSGGSNRQNISLVSGGSVGLGNASGNGYFRFTNGFSLVKGGAQSDASTTIGGTAQMAIDSSGNTVFSGSVAASFFTVANTTFASDKIFTTGALAINYEAGSGDVVINNGSSNTTLNGVVSTANFKINGRRLWIGGSAPSGPSSGDVWIVA